MNGERLRPEQGYPARLVVPGWEGNMWVKWLRRIEVGDQPWHAPGGDVEIHRPSGQRKRAALHLGHGRQVGHHQPEPAGADHPWQGADRAHRLAWSGNGTHHAGGCHPRRRQELASGAHRRAEPLDKSMHRFYYEFDWDGSAAAAAVARHDETGYVQPTKDELRRCAARIPSITTTASRPGT
jgi:sulfane dehydrogenase subunit SoxC